MSQETPLIQKLRELENWNHDQFVDAKADGSSFYEHADYERGVEEYARAEAHRIASSAIEKALAASLPAADTGLIEELTALVEQWSRSANLHREWDRVNDTAQVYEACAEALQELLTRVSG